MAQVSFPHPVPKPAVNETCQVCGSTVYCGGVLCPSSSLPLSPDGMTQISTPYISVTVKSVNSNFQNGVSAGRFGPGAG